MGWRGRLWRGRYFADFYIYGQRALRTVKQQFGDVDAAVAALEQYERELVERLEAALEVARWGRPGGLMYAAADVLKGAPAPEVHPAVKAYLAYARRYLGLS
ncbi:hypothetical protein [Pyrobaculum sp.]|uniref:hypothetical protein n=1 Tax=Pyrobaculum sp. TaxID=2004705 RepID=UPI003D0CCA46